MAATAADLKPHISYVLDTALSPDHGADEIGPGTYLVGWQCGYEPLVVAVIASYTEAVDEADAEEIAADYLEEIGWFGAGGRRDADHIAHIPAE